MTKGGCRKIDTAFCHAINMIIVKTQQQRHHRS